MNYRLRRPCKHCPFRTDIVPFLTQDRAEEIFTAITDQQQTFQCHKTLDLPRQKQEHCAGAMILLEKLERPNQMMRIAERTGMYDRRKLDMNSPVFDTGEEFIMAQEWR